jgi:2-oxoglutarate ferredoxin oxidoreductase subunit gamma
MDRTEIRVSGYGGQGVILAAHIMGKAASIFQGLNATMNQAFGPEARGSACSAQLVVDDDAIFYPYIRKPQVLIAMSKEAYEKFSPEVAPGGTILIESDLVQPENKRDDVTYAGVPATRYAEELGRRLVLNMVMLGFFTAQTDVLDPEAAREAVASSVPAGTEELNLAAFDKGFGHVVESN